jgi:hypothetical protein
VQGGLLFWGIWETCNGTLWKHSISFIGLQKGNLRHSAREGSANMFIGLGYCPPTGHNLGFYWPHYWT